MKELLLNNNKWDEVENMLIERVDMFHKVHVMVGNDSCMVIYESKHTYAEFNDIHKVSTPMSWKDIVVSGEYDSEFNQIGTVNMYGQG